MFCSTVILSFNKPKLTIRCLESVLAAYNQAQNQGEIFVVDNGSNLETRETIDQFIRQNAPHVEVLTIRENQGFSRGMNFGLRTAFSRNANTVLTLSNDVELNRNFFENLKGIELDGILGPRTFNQFDRKFAYSHGELNLESMELTHHKDSAKKKIKFPEYYPAASLVWTRDAFEKLQGFDGGYFCYWEDVDLSYRAGKFGVALNAESRLLVYHLGRGTTKGKRVYTDHFANGKLRLLDKLNCNSHDEKGTGTSKEVAVE